MKRIKIHILPEHGQDLRPFGSAYIRLLRPLTHPLMADELEVTVGMNYSGAEADLVIVDRLWRPDVTPEMANDLMSRIAHSGAAFLYALDDDLLHLPAELSYVHDARYPEVVSLFLQKAHGIMLSTQALSERIGKPSGRLFIVPNSLDERLLIHGRKPRGPAPFKDQRLTVGYMGTATHDADLNLVIPALEKLSTAMPGRIEFQMIGVSNSQSTISRLQRLPFRRLTFNPPEAEYPLFMMWFGSNVHWDLAIAPLCDSDLNNCKSHIKFLDYSAICCPGIYSRSAAYDQTVVDGETGILVDNSPEAWEAALETLLTNRTLRYHIAERANRCLWEHHTLKINTHNLLAAIRGTLA